MYLLDWTSDEPLQGEKLAFFAVIPLATFACTFWLLVVGHPVLFATIMIGSAVITIMIVRNRKGTRITIDDRYFRFGMFNRVSLTYISSVRMVTTTIGSDDVLEVGTRGDEGTSFNMNGVPDHVRKRILAILEQRLVSE
jgi:hypothetical protein